MDSKERLNKLIQDNPNLPLIFMVNNPDICMDYGCSVYKEWKSYVSEVYCIEEEYGIIFYDDIDDVQEIFEDRMCNEDKYKDLSDEEFSKMVKDFIEKNIEHYKAIVVYCFN